MSENVEDTTAEPIQVSGVVPKKRKKKVYKFQFMTSANLKNVRRDQVLAYIRSLHRKIRLLWKESRRYREKIFKLVCFFKFSVMNIVKLIERHHCRNVRAGKKTLNSPRMQKMKKM